MNDFYDGEVIAVRRILILFFCLFALAGAAWAADAEITALNTDVTVGEDGTAQVTMTAEVEFSAAVQELQIPLGTGAKDIVLSGWAYKKTTVDGATCLTLSNPAGFSGKQSFSCTYTLPSGVTETSSGQRFRLYAPQTGWEYAIGSMTLRVAFPAAVTTAPEWTSGYYEDIIDNYLKIDVTENTVTAQSIEALKDHETLQMDVQFPAGTFRVGNLPGKTAKLDTLLFFVLLLAALAYWFFLLRYSLILPRQQQTAGTDSTAGEVPCQLYGAPADPAGVVAHWGNLGYVRIVRSRRGRVLLYKQMEMGNERKPVERKFFKTIFRNGDVCDARSPRFQAAAGQMKASVRRSWLRRLFSPHSGSPLVLRGIGLAAGLAVSLMLFDVLLPAGGARWVFLVLLTLVCGSLHFLVQRAILMALRRGRRVWLPMGLGALVTLALLGHFAGKGMIVFLDVLLQSFCALTTIFGGRRTQTGQEQARRLLGLRRFLRRADQGTLQRLIYQDPQYFYRMLPFADALGAAAPFVRHLGRLAPETCGWLHDAEDSVRTPEDFYRLYLEMAAAVRGENYRAPKAAPPRRRPPAPRPAAVQSRPQRPHRRAEYDYDEI